MITRTTIGLDGEEIINIDTVSTIKVFEIEIADLQAEVAKLNTKVLQLEEALEILLEMKKHGRKNTRKSKRNGGKRK